MFKLKVRASSALVVWLSADGKLTNVAWIKTKATRPKD